MKILIGSKSEAKKEALIIALEKLGIYDYEIDSYKALSGVRDNPINDETKEGAINRNNDLKRYIEQNSLIYDMLVSIEAGYTEENGSYYLDTYVCVTYNNIDYIGIGPRLRISKIIFEYVEKQNMLHELINKLRGEESINGAIGFITKDVVKRSDIEAYAIIDALVKALGISYNNDSIDFEKDILDDRIKTIENCIMNS